MYNSSFCGKLYKKLEFLKKFFDGFKADLSLTKEYDLKDLKSTRNKAKHVKRLIEMTSKTLELIEALDFEGVIDNLSLLITNNARVSSTATPDGEYDEIKDREDAIKWLMENTDIDPVGRRIVVLGNFEIVKGDAVFLPDNLQVGNLDLSGAETALMPDRLMVDELDIRGVKLGSKANIYFPHDMQVNGDVKLSRKRRYMKELHDLKQPGRIKGQVLVIAP